MARLARCLEGRGVITPLSFARQLITLNLATSRDNVVKISLRIDRRFTSDALAESDGDKATILQKTKYRCFIIQSAMKTIINFVLDGHQSGEMEAKAAFQWIFNVPDDSPDGSLADDLRDPAVSTTTCGQSLKTHLFSACQHV